MKRKIIKFGRGSIIYIPPILLELLGISQGDYIEITYNQETKKIEISKIKNE
ncbi:MAG: hypothetical protein JSU91_01965 [Thermoplasmatales archaeon]|nr:MAG: hypothetical protein JSU91_01965 [Thermoplasmatales archaeon]